MESSGHVGKLAATAGAVVAVALAAAGCAPARHVAASAAAARHAAAHEALPVKQAVPCTATVTKWHPADGTSVGVRVRTAPGAQISVTAHYLTVSRGKAAQANAAGRHTFRYRASAAAPGYRVNVDVVVSQGKEKGSCATWFTPRRTGTATGPAPEPAPASSPSPAAAAPPPAPAAPPPAPASAAWCTATASVYNASENWNNVYVNSNQPYESATASADGYSWSYETNGSGYAEIYLNGPPPGALITVTIGGATCTTSD